VRYAFIAEKQVAFPVSTLCRVLDVSRSGYYGFVAEPETERARRDASLTAKTRAVFAEHQGRYGSPRVCRELRGRGDRVSEKTVARLMRENALVARRRRRFRATTDSKHDDPVAPNLLARDFSATRPNEAWVTDVTAIWTAAGWLFFAAILDLYSRRVVGWATSANNDRDLALDALRAALIARRPPPGLVHHSDRGSPYASADYRRALDRAGAVASMSRKGDCWDNAVAESFFATLKTEALGDRVPVDHDLATRAIGEYVDGYYNPKRRHSFIDYDSPIEFELKGHIAAMAA
jgi:transposase InsO family protein